MSTRRIFPLPRWRQPLRSAKRRAVNRTYKGVGWLLALLFLIVAFAVVI